MKSKYNSIYLVIFMVSMPFAIHSFSCNGQQSSGRYKNGVSQKQSRKDFIREAQEVDQAFNDLQRELDQSKQQDEKWSFNNDINNDDSDDDFSKEQTSSKYDHPGVDKTKEWVNKALDIVSDLNADFTKSTDEAKQTEKDIRQVREWINRIYDAGTKKEGSDEEEPSSSSKSKKEKFEKELVTIEPDYEIFDNKSNGIWMCSIDMPGVEKSDVDIQFQDEKNILTIEGKRYQRFGRQEDDGDTPSPTAVTKLYRKTFSLLEDDRIETDKISAKLENGVLTLSAPKKRIEEEEIKTRKIPIL